MLTLGNQIVSTTTHFRGYWHQPSQIEIVNFVMVLQDGGISLNVFLLSATLPLIDLGT